MRPFRPSAALDAIQKRQAAAAGQALHCCPACGSKLVQPIRWEQTSSLRHWRLWRQCPDCEWQSDGIHGEAEIDAFDEALEEGAEILAAVLEQLERQEMRQLHARLSAAFAADLITADDFRPH